MSITIIQIEIFMLILARIIGLFQSGPIISAKTIPVYIKICLAIWFATTLWFIVPIPYTPPGTVTTFVIAIISEVFIGYIIGFVSNLIIQSIQAAGDFADVQMGLSVANVLSPTTGYMSSVVGTLAFYIALIIFFIVNGHHMIFSAIHQSFTVLPVSIPLDFSTVSFIEQLLSLIRFFWGVAIRLAAPSVLLIFLSDFSFGIVSRVAPQVNVFMLGFQVKPSLGLLGLLLTIPLYAAQVMRLIAQIQIEIGKAFMVIK